MEAENQEKEKKKKKKQEYTYNRISLTYTPEEYAVLVRAYDIMRNFHKHEFGERHLKSVPAYIKQLSMTCSESIIKLHEEERVTGRPMKYANE